MNQSERRKRIRCHGIPLRGQPIIPSAWGSGRQLQYRANWWFRRSAKRSNLMRGKRLLIAANTWGSSLQLLLSLKTLLCWLAITFSLPSKCCAIAVLLCNNMCSQISWVTTRHLNRMTWEIPSSKSVTQQSCYPIWIGHDCLPQMCEWL